MLRYVLLLFFICCGFQQSEAGDSEVIYFNVPNKRFEISINKILIGKSVVEQNYVYENQRNDYLGRNYDVIYFNVTIKNLNGEDDQFVSYVDFLLEDEDGESYSPNSSNDCIRGDVRLGKKISGGVIFAIKKGSVPMKLLWDTGYRYKETRAKIYAEADNLNLRF